MSWLTRAFRVSRCRQQRWSLEAPRLLHVAGVTRVTANVAGSALWFESRDVRLEPSVEAWASACLLPAMQYGMTVDVDSPVDERWSENTRCLVPIFAEWWDHDAAYPFRLQAAPAAASAGTSAGESASGLCFTCGVDSFFTLLRGETAVDYLVYVHGFDLGLRDHGRMMLAERSLRAVAAELGRRLLVVKTNFRQHPVLATVDWKRLHGAGLAAVGHLLSGHLGRLVVAPSWTGRSEMAWGSHWKTDPLWSSSRLRLMHSETELSRHERIRAMAGEPLVWNHLRVCWMPGTQLNCSRCEKCLRTMAYLDECGQLGRYRVFDQRESLAARIDSLSHVPEHLVPFWSRLAASDLGLPVRRAIQRLVDRSQSDRSAREPRQAA